MEDQTSYGRRPNGIYIPRFRNVKDKHPDFLRGYGFQGGGSRGTVSQPKTGFGADFKQALLRKPELQPWRFSIGGWAECLPREDNFIALHPTWWTSGAFFSRCNAPGDPANCPARRHAEDASRCWKPRRADIRPTTITCLPGSASEMGTARMDATRLVLAGNNQVDEECVRHRRGLHDLVRESESSITYMALTARAAEFAVESLKRNEL
jgi:hypothetical protein